MLSNIFGKQSAKISDNTNKQEFFNLKQFRANFKRETEAHKEKAKAQMSLSRYSQNRFTEVDKDSSKWIQDRYQPINRFKRSPEHSRRNDSFISTSQIQIPNFLKESDRDQRSKRYSLPRNTGLEKGSFISRVKDTSTVSKYSVRSTFESKFESANDRFLTNNSIVNQKVAIKRHNEAPLQVQQNIEKVKRDLIPKDPLIESKPNYSLSKEIYDKKLTKTTEVKHDPDEIELVSRIQNLKSRLDIKAEASSRLVTEPDRIDKYLSRKTTFKDIEVTRPVATTRKLTKLEHRLPLEEVKQLKQAFENVDTFELNQLPNG